MRNKMETYLINLDRTEDRRVMMEKQFEKHNIPFVRIPAVDGKNLDKYEYKVVNKYDRDLVPGEIGCYLSHIEVMRAFLASDNDFALIIEDDAILCDGFKTVLNTFITSYDTLPEKHKWDVLKLSNRKRRHIRIADVYNDYFLAACGTSVPITTLAAVWTRKGAEKFLHVVDNPVPLVRRPIDCDLQHPWEFDLRIYNALPSPVKPANFKTTIHSDKKDRKSKFPRQIIYELNRLYPKYHYLISNHGFKNFYNSFIAKKTPIIS